MKRVNHLMLIGIREYIKKMKGDAEYEIELGGRVVSSPEQYDVVVEGLNKVIDSEEAV